MHTRIAIALIQSSQRMTRSVRGVGEETHEVRLEVVERLGDECDGRARAALGEPPLPAIPRRAEHLRAQVGYRAQGSPVPVGLLKVDDASARREGDGGRGEGREGPGQVGLAVHEGRDGSRYAHALDDRQHGQRQARRDEEHRVSAGGAGVRQQARVQGLHVVLPRLPMAWRRGRRSRGGRPSAPPPPVSGRRIRGSSSGPARRARRGSGPRPGVWRRPCTTTPCRRGLSARTRPRRSS